MSADTLALLRAGKLAGATRLDLSCGLAEFPPEIHDLADSLEILNLTGNRLSDLPDDLPRVLAELSQKLRLITHQEDALAELRAKAAQEKKKYTDAAQKISAARKKAAEKLSKAVNGELPDLKLDKAKFSITSQENDWSPTF